MISFQFSPVRIMKIVTRADEVVPKLYLDSLPSMSNNFSLKNYFVSSAEMKRYKIISTPRLVMAVRESNTVDKRIRRDSHDLMILKILSNLKALSTDRLESESGITNST
jgi:hypothetical protein